MPSVKQETITRKLVDAARPHLGGETVLAMFRGHTGVPPVVVPLIGSVLFKPRIVMVTQSFVVTLQQSVWSQSSVVGLVSRHASGSVPIEVGRWGLKIADDAKVFAALASLEDMREVARLAGARPGGA
jgi:hypothetical protein